jgi:hypothetical protein
MHWKRVTDFWRGRTGDNTQGVQAPPEPWEVANLSMANPPCWLAFLECFFPCASLPGWWVALGTAGAEAETRQEGPLRHEATKYLIDSPNRNSTVRGSAEGGWANGLMVGGCICGSKPDD